MPSNDPIENGDFNDVEVPTPRPKWKNPINRSAYELKKFSGINVRSSGVEALSAEVGQNRSTASFTAATHGTLQADAAGRFAFTSEIETATIRWRLRGHDNVTALRLELFRAGSADAIWTRTFTWQAGTCTEHGSTLWDGTFAASDVVNGQVREVTTFAPDLQRFPNQRINAANGPYKLRLSILPGDFRRNPAARFLYLDPRAAPRIRVQPDDISILDAMLNVASGSHDVTITNIGDADLRIDSLAPTGGAHDQFELEHDNWARTVTPGQSITVPVRASLSAWGTHDSDLEIRSNAVNTAVVQVGLKAIAPPPIISVTPTPVDCGAWSAGATAQPKNLQITNTGGRPLDLTSITVTDANGGQFAAPTDVQQLQINGSMDVPVTFTARTAGRQQGALQIVSNAANSPTLDVELVGSVFNLKDLVVPEFLASGAEMAKVKYTVEDPATVITGGTFEVLRKSDGAALFSRALRAEEYASGPVEFEWDGSINAHGDFPDQFVTVVHSPYTVRITATAGNDPPATVSADIKVEAEKLELEAGPQAVLTAQKYKDVYDGTIPASAQTRKLFLKSDSYCLLDNEDAHDNNKDYTLYETMWGDGPMIPIRAKVLFKAAEGPSKLAPLAWGTAKVLWDAEDVDKDLSGLAAAPSAFVASAQDRQKANTLPPGTNCPGDLVTAGEDLGGKRTPTAAGRRFFPASTAWGGDVQDWDYTVTALPNPRAWCAYSEPLKVGDQTVRGTTGAIFRPSRMAGDRYKVRALFDVKGAHNKLGAITEPVSDSTGIFEIWRKLHIQKVYRKHGSVTSFTLATLADFYAKAYVEVDDVSGGAELFPENDYNTAFENAINGRPDDNLRKYGYNDKANQFTTGGKAACGVHTWDQFKTAYLAGTVTDLAVNNLVVTNKRALDAVTVNDIGHVWSLSDQEDYAKSKLPVGALGPAITNYINTHPGEFTDKRPLTLLERQTRIRNWYTTDRTNTLIAAFGANEAAARDKYQEDIIDHAATVTETGCDSLLTNANANGVVIFLFEWGTSLPADLHSTNGQALYGSALRLPNLHNRRSRTAYLHFKPHAGYTEVHVPMEGTVAHEIGHQLFLPHTKMESAAKDDVAHDAADHSCIMSYNYAAPRRFCGYCLLRLRGWNHTRLSDNGATNARRPAVKVTEVGDFGATVVNAESSAKTFTVRNTGNAPLSVTGITLEGGDAGQFELKNLPGLPATVAANATINFQLVFKPTTVGTKTVSVRVASNAPGSPQDVAVSSDGAAPAITVTADTGAVAPVDYGQVRHETELERTLTVTNSGNAPLIVGQLALGGRDQVMFELRDDAASGQTIDPADARTVKVAFKSKLGGEYKTKQDRVAGAREAALTIPSNAAGAPTTIELRADSRRLPVFEVAPSPHDFGALVVTQSSADRAFVVRNTGNAPMNLTNIDVTGADAASFESNPASGWAGAHTVNPGGSVSIDAKFTPAGALGAKSGALRFTTTAPGSPHSVALAGTATTQVSVTPSPVNFAPTAINATSASVAVTITNSGASPITLTGITRSGADKDAFTSNALVGDSWVGAFVVNGGSSANVQFAFSPTGVAGARSATLTFTSSAADSPHTVTLNGTAT